MVARCVEVVDFCLFCFCFTPVVLDDLPIGAETDKDKDSDDENGTLCIV